MKKIIPLLVLLIFSCKRSTEEAKSTPEAEEEKNYTEALLSSIKNYWSEENQNKLKLQSKKINDTYSWDVRSVEWKNFFDKIRKLKN